MWLKQSTTITLQVGPFVDKTDGVTPETGLTPGIEVSKNGAVFAARNSATAVAHDSEGFYRIELNGTDTNTLGRLKIKAIDSANHVPVFHELMVVAANVWDSLFGSDKLQIDVAEWIGTAVTTSATSTLPEVDAKSISDDAIAADNLELITENARGADNKILISSDAQDLSTTLDVNTKTLSANAITAAAIATGAIDADAIASDAITEIRSVVNGTADSGTTTTMVDANRTEADTDYWNDSWILFTNGNIAGQARLITGFNAATDTITFTPATTQAVATQMYEIISAAYIASITGSVGSVSGNVDGNVTGNIDGSVGSLGATAKSDVNTEVVDVLKTDTTVQPSQSAPAAAQTMEQMIAFLYKAWRNKSTQTSSNYKLFNDDGTTVDHKATVSDDATTFTRNEMATGP